MLTDIGVFAAAIGAVLAASAALWAAKENRKATKALLVASEVQLLLDLLREYSADSMSEAMQTLKNWRRDYRESYKDEFENRYRTKDISVFPPNRARLTVFRYFQRILQLYKSGYLSQGFCNVILKMGDSEVLFSVVEPFDEIASRIEQTQPNSKAVFDSLRMIINAKSSV
jgi:hypothetical protein